MSQVVKKIDVDWQGVAAKLLQAGAAYAEVVNNTMLQNTTRDAASVTATILTEIGSAINNNLVESPTIAVANDQEIRSAVYAVLHDHLGTLTPDEMRHLAENVVEYVRSPE